MQATRRTLSRLLFAAITFVTAPFPGHAEFSGGLAGTGPAALQAAVTSASPTTSVSAIVLPSSVLQSPDVAPETAAQPREKTGCTDESARREKTKEGETTKEAGVEEPESTQDVFAQTAPPSSVDRIDQFQRFVFETTGQARVPFGRKLFNNPAFPLRHDVPVLADYRVGQGDELQVSAWGAIDLDATVTVDCDGQIRLPKVGVLSVAGITVGELEPYIKTKVGRLYKSFSLNVTLARLRGIQVNVVGHARRPGAHVLAPYATLFNALFAFGGPGIEGSMRHNRLPRNGKPITEVDLYAFLNQGDQSSCAQAAVTRDGVRDRPVSLGRGSDDPHWRRTTGDIPRGAAL